MGEEAPKAGELGDGCRGSEKWENSQKGGSSSVEEGIHFICLDCGFYSFPGGPLISGLLFSVSGCKITSFCVYFIHTVFILHFILYLTQSPHIIHSLSSFPGRSSSST